MVQVSLLIPAAIMTAAGLEFSRIGCAATNSRVGRNVAEQLDLGRLAPHMMIFPGLTLMLVVFGFNIFGDGLRDALDPRINKT